MSPNAASEVMVLIFIGNCPVAGCAVETDINYQSILIALAARASATNQTDHQWMAITPKTIVAHLQ